MANGIVNLVLPRVPPMPDGAGLPQPLGTFQGYAILRHGGRAVAVRHDRLGRGSIAALYAARPDLLSRTWPRRSGRGWDHLQASMSIVAACAEIGRVDPELFGIVVTYLAPGAYQCRKARRR